MSALQACEGRRPWPWRRRSRPAGPEARRAGERGGPGWASRPFPRRLKGSGERGGRAGLGCAGSLRGALAHGPLRNRQRRGFPRGGSLSSTITHSRAPPRLTKWRRPWIRRRPLPVPILCEARDLSTWNTSAEDASDWEARVRERSPRGPCCTTSATARRSVLFRLLRAKPPRPRARCEKGSGRQRRAAAGCSGDSRRGDGGPGSGGTRTGRAAVVKREPACLPRARSPRGRGSFGSGNAESRCLQRRPRRPGRRVHRRDGDGTILDLLSRRSPTWDCMLLMSLGGHRNVLLPNSCTGQACWAFNFQVQEQNGGMTCWHFTRGRLTLRRQRML